jgi:Co/Zn/Cd efflux system component
LQRDFNLTYDPISDHFCNLHDELNWTQESNSSISFYKEFQVEIVYYPVLLLFFNPYFESGTHHNDQFCRNQNSYLDSRELPSLIVLPIVFSLVILLIGLWVYLNLKNKGRLLRFQILSLTVLHILFFFTLLFKYISLKHEDKNDRIRGIRWPSIILDSIFYFYYFSFAFLGIRGFKLIPIDYIHIFALISSFGLSIYPMIGNISELFNILYSGFLSFFVIIYAYSIYRAFKSSRNLILAHFHSILQNGIDPITTPRHLKMIALKYLTVITAIVIVIQIIFIILFLLLFGIYWIIDLFYSSLIFALIFVYGWFYRPRADDIDKYLIEEAKSDDIERDEVYFDDLPNDDVSQTGQQWNSSIPLPPRPRLIERRQYETALISNADNYTNVN